MQTRLRERLRYKEEEEEVKDTRTHLLFSHDMLTGCCRSGGSPQAAEGRGGGGGQPPQDIQRQDPPSSGRQSLGCVALLPWGRYHGGQRPSSDDSLHSPTVIPPSALDKPSIMKLYHRRRTCSHTSPRPSPTMVTLHDTRFVECRWWNDGWTVKTVVT